MMRNSTRAVSAAVLAVVFGAFGAASALGAEGDLTFLRCLEDPGAPSGCPAVAAVDGGLSNATDVAVSPDGKYVYAVGTSDDSIAAFTRDPSTGALSFIERERDGVDDTSDPGATVDGLDGAFGLAIPPDGKHVYVIANTDLAVAAFARNPTTGSLSFVSCLEDTGAPSGCPSTGGVDGLGLNAFSLAVSPDGKSVYAAGFGESSIVTFSRDSATGALTFVGCLRDDSGVSGCPNTGGVDGIRAARAVTVSPDGAYVYVTGADTEDSVATFSRNQSTGALAFVGCLRDDTGASGCPNTGGVDGLDGAAELAISPDGKHLYVSGSTDDALAAFSRNAISGTLTFVGCLEDTGGASASCLSTGAADGLDGVRDVALSPDGKTVYGAGVDDDAISTLSRNPTTGALTFLGCLEDTGGPSGCPSTGGVDGLDAIVGVAVAPDGGHVYGVGLSDSALATFARSPDLTTPDTTGLSGPPATTADNTPTFTFASDDLLFTRFECRVDEGPFFACSSPYTSFALADGPHRFQVRAVDTAGNVDATPAESSFTVDTPDPVVTPPVETPPAAVPDTAAPDTELTTEPPFSLTAKKKTARAKFEFAASEAGSRFECRLDSASFSSCSSPQNLKLKLGPHTFRVHAIDAAGNADFSAAKWQGNVAKKPKKG
jgi:6-phosphogluconolactonase (cycloisomerase 2 family)